MQCVHLTDDELWKAIARNTTVMSALVYRRIELDAGKRDGVIDRAQLMQSNAETITKLECKYREYTDELRRRYPDACKQPVSPATETVAVEVIDQSAPGVTTATEVEERRPASRAGQRDCAAMREGQGIMNVLRSLWAAARRLHDVRSNSPHASRA
jgi:hypothetical protein